MQSATKTQYAEKQINSNYIYKKRTKKREKEKEKNKPKQTKTQKQTTFFVLRIKNVIP